MPPEEDEIQEEYNENEGNENIVTLPEFQEIVEIFHEEVQNQSLITISQLLYQFFSNISYEDDNSNMCYRFLSDDSLYFLKENQEIIDDIIFCLNTTHVELERLTFELCDYLSNQSDFFINDFLDRDGLDYIIPHVNVLGSVEIILKSIQLIGKFSNYEKSYPKLIVSDFTRNFFNVCLSLFTNDRFKKNINKIAYQSAFLLRKVVDIIMKQISTNPYPMHQLAEPQMYHQLMYHQKRNTAKIIDHQIIYKIILTFFGVNKAIHAQKYSCFPHIQREAIKTFILLREDFYFISKVFPFILSFLPKMIKENMLILKNKIKLYKLISLFYEDEVETKRKLTFIEISDQPNGNSLFPWNMIIKSLSSESKKEVFAALGVFKSLFKCDKISIEIAFKKELYNIFMGMIEGASYEIKEQALNTVFTWLTCTTCDSHKEPFVDPDFVDLLFDLLNTPEESLNRASLKVIRQIELLNYQDDEFQYLISERLKTVSFDFD